MTTRYYFDWTALAGRAWRDDGASRLRRDPPHAVAGAQRVWDRKETIVPLLELLERGADPIIAHAEKSLGGCHLSGYQASNSASTHDRLRRLYLHVVECLRARRLEPIQVYARAIANERFRAGYDIGDVQVAINALEEAMWSFLVQHRDEIDLPRSLGLISTVLGAAKDALAQAYVVLASRAGAPTLDLEAVINGPREWGGDDWPTTDGSRG